MVSKKTNTSKKEAPKSTKKEQQKTTSKKQEQFSWRELQPMLKTIIIPVVLILAIMWYAFMIRAGTTTLDGLDQRVEQNLMQQVQQIITQRVQQQYPNLNQRNQQELVAKQYKEVLDSGTLQMQGQEISIDNLVQQQSQNIKQQFKADNGQTYLSAIDPYLYYNYATDVLENGHPGDQVKEDKEGDLTPFASYRLAPEGRFVGEMSFHTWLEVQLMKLQGVTPDSSVGEKTSAIFFLSAIVAMLSVIPCFLILRKFTDDISATMATLLMVSIGTFVSRTVAGFVDTDAYVVFFPLAIVASMVYAFMYERKSLTITLAVLAGIMQGLFIWAWTSGWFIFVFLLTALIGYALYLLIIYLIQLKSKQAQFRDKLINTLITAGTYLISAVVFTFLITGRNILTLTYNGIFGAFERVASVSTTYIWPNVFSSVAELNPASFSQVISSVGGTFVFFLALMGVVLLALDYRAKNKKHDLIRKIILGFSAVWFGLVVFMETFVSLTANSPFLFIFLLFIPVALAIVFSLLNNNISPKIFMAMLLGSWIAGTVFMTFNGTRFILLLAPAFSIAFGFSLFYITQAINKFFVEEFKIEKPLLKQTWGVVVTAIIFLIIFVPMAQSSMQISQSSTPNFDDGWYSAMEEIKTNTSEDAIITSWWDFGHFFAAISERGVTFDGGSQTTPQSHWVGKLLVETDEEKSADILKMLVCGGNQAFEKISNITDDPTNGVWSNELIYETLGKSREETVEILNNYEHYNFTDEEVDEVMQYLDCEEPRESLLITSGDMVNKGGVWAHWGLWDFTKKYVHDNYQDKTAKQISEELQANQSQIEQYVNELENIDVRAQTQGVSRENLINEWFAPYPSYAQSSQCGQTNEILQCQNGIQINMSSGEVLTDDFRQGASVKRLVVPQENGLETIEQDESGTFDIVVIPNQQGAQIRLMQSPLGTSLFTKLYFLNGLGTTKFENFYQVQTQTAGNVIVWRTLFGEDNTTSSQNTSPIEASSQQQNPQTVQ